MPKINLYVFMIEELLSYIIYRKNALSTNQFIDYKLQITDYKLCANLSLICLPGGRQVIFNLSSPLAAIT